MVSGIRVLRLQSADGTNRLNRACALELTAAVHELSRIARPLIIAGNHKFFSAGAELSEIAALTGPAAYDFSKMGQELMNSVARFPYSTLREVRHSKKRRGHGKSTHSSPSFQVAPSSPPASVENRECS